MSLLPSVAPMPLARFDAPFEHPDWIFEPKLDGFRALACGEDSAQEVHSFTSKVERPSAKLGVFAAARSYLIYAALSTFSPICVLIKCLVLSMNASLSAKQVSSSTATPGCPSVSATVMRAW